MLRNQKRRLNERILEWHGHVERTVQQVKECEEKVQYYIRRYKKERKTLVEMDRCNG